MHFEDCNEILQDYAGEGMDLVAEMARIQKQLDEMMSFVGNVGHSCRENSLA